MAAQGPVQPLAAPAELSAKVIEEFFLCVTENTGVLNRERYCAFHACMFRALRQEFEEKQALQRAAMDFVADAKGASFVEKGRFCHMLKTLSERWTAGSDGSVVPEHAAQFVRKLFLSISYLDVRLGSNVRRLLPWSAVPLGSCIPPSRRRSPSTRDVPGRSRTFPQPRPTSPQASEDEQSPDAAPSRSRRLSDSVLPSLSSATSGNGSTSMPELRIASPHRSASGKVGSLPAIATDSCSRQSSLCRFAVLNSARVRGRSDNETHQSAFRASSSSRVEAS
eukprot:tig00000733_g3776.t1